MKTNRYLLSFVLIAVAPVLATAQNDSPEGYFNQNVADSNPLRTEQARELDEYIKTIAADRTRFENLFSPNYSSTQAFEQSAEPLRRAFCASIGYPPPGERPEKPASFTQIGEDSIGTTCVCNTATTCNRLTIPTIF